MTVASDILAIIDFYNLWKFYYGIEQITAALKSRYLTWIYDSFTSLHIYNRLFYIGIAWLDIH